MKKLYFIMLATVVTLTSCLSENDESQKLIIDPVNWLAAQFQFKSDTLETFPYNVFNSAEEIQKYLVGNGWKHKASFAIKEDGSVEQKPYYGVSPIDYYFNDANTLTEFFYSDAEAGKLVSKTHKWAYIENESVISIDPLISATPAPRIMQILEAKERTMTVVQLIGFRGQDGKPLYAVSIYAKMTAKELNEKLSR
ncbi:MAG: hypothetical protein K2H97_07130 [Prevotella sp.]|nr:hypothetical protein [Prevotella sp.]